MYKRTVYLISILGTLMVNFSGCSDLLEVGLPRNQLVSENVFADSASTVSALNNIYHTLGNGLHDNFVKHISLYSDEYAFSGPDNNAAEFYQSRLSAGNTWNLNIWANLFFIVYSCNNLIEQVKQSEDLSISAKDQFIGEAKFLRAFAYFHLLNLYENVPLLLQTEVTGNRQAHQAHQSAITDQVLSDLTDARDRLSIGYPSAGKVRANRFATTSLLSRVYLYSGNWGSAEALANEVINSGSYSLSVSIDEVFIAGNDEAILQLWTQYGYVTDAFSFIPWSPGTVPQYPVINALYESLENGDLRLGWIGSNSVITGDATTTYHYPYKYRNMAANTARPEYVMLFRLAEQYLIRAEARANMGNVTGAVADINAIRVRAGLIELSPDLTLEACLDAIRQERSVELFGEWGHRFFDLKRTGRLDEVIGAYKSTWEITASTLPIPQSEINYNPNLIQNNGY